MENFADTRQPTPEVAQLVALVQELQQDFVSQKAELEAKIERLETKLAERPVTPIAAAPEIAAPPTSRRRMLKKLGLVAAGVAAASAAAIAVEPNSASASTTTFDFAGTSAGVGNNTATGTTTINSTITTPILVLNNTATGTTGTPDGLNASSDNGVAVQGLAKSSAKSGIVGINGTSITGIALSSPAGVAGFSSSVFGVQGASNSFEGVYGASSNAVGVRGRSVNQPGGGFQVDKNNDGAANSSAHVGQIIVKPSDKVGPPINPNSMKGEIYIDSAGNMYVCTTGAGGINPEKYAPGSLMREIAEGNAPPSATTNWSTVAYSAVTPAPDEFKVKLLNKPIRVYDSRFTTNITPTPMSPGETRIVQVQGTFTPPTTGAVQVDIPAGKGVFGNIACVNTLGPNNAYNGGFFTLFSADISYDPSVPFANMNIQNVGAPLNNQFLVKSGQSGANINKMGVYLGSGNPNTRCHFIIDITAVLV